MTAKKIQKKSKIGFKKSGITRKTALLIMVLLVALGSFLRLWGFNWGIPQKPYWRPLHQDEAFVISMLLRMNPHDLNPHYFINPSLHYYTLLISIKIAQVMGYIKTFSQPVKLNIIALPTEKCPLKDYRRLFVISRLLTTIEGIISLLLIYYIATKLFNKKTGLIATAIFAILPTPVIQSHFFVADGPALFWAMLALAYLVKSYPQPDISKRWFVISGFLIGLAVGAKYLNILLIFPFLTLVISNARLSRKKLILYLAITFFMIILVFLVTTPHAVISWREFFFGDKDGFGGLFGSSGLFAYNRYPSHILKPFSVGLYHSLRLPLFLLALCSLIYSLYFRKLSLLILLSFIIPFYIIMIISPSPHLRHTLPVLPFITIMMAYFISTLLNSIKNLYLRYSFIFYLLLSLFYTLLCSLSFIQRMNYTDSRIACADWFFNNIPYGTSFGAPTVMPFRYTPPLEYHEYNSNRLAPTDEFLFSNLSYPGIKTNYDYELLKAVAPEYFIITETEITECPYSKVGGVQARFFIKRLFSEENYKMIKVFKRDFEIFGIKFNLDFPNTDWNPVSQKIYLFKRK
ncbi:MAG: ArnT family glycosyltransferase [bacterium]